MKKFGLIAILLMPLIVTATPMNFEISWDPYPYPTALMTVSCGVNSAAKVSVGAVTAATNVLPFNLDVNPGDNIGCVAQASLNGDVSPSSQEATAHVPLALPAPVIHVRVVP